MPSPSDSRSSPQSPRFEALEERLLLTTLVEGESFIYYNSQEQAVRVNLYDSDPNVTAKCELTAWYTWQADPTDPTTYISTIADLPGFWLDMSLPLTGMIDAGIGQWPDGEEIFTPEYEWQSYDDQHRGAEAEIWAVYFSASSDSTILTIAQMANGDLTSPTWLADVDDLTPWTGDVLVDIDQVEIRTPDGSGTVLVGGIPAFFSGRDGVDYIASPDDADIWFTSGLGVFPGGNLRPGVTVSGDGYSTHGDVGDFGVGGTEVHAMATDSAGTVIAIDSSALIPWMEGYYTGFTSYSLGDDVSSLAADSSGELWAANNARNIHMYTQWGAAGYAFSIAADGSGNTYVVDQTIRSLVRVDPLGQPTTVGLLRDAVSSAVVYEWVTGLDFNPVNGTLYGVGYRVSSMFAWPDLLAIDPNTGIVTSKVQLDLDISRIDSIAFANDGSETLYAAGKINGVDNQLMTIDINTGLATVVGSLTIAASDHLAGMDFLGGTLYGVTSGDFGGGAGAELFVVDPATGTCTAIDVLDGYDLMGLAFDASVPGVLITTASMTDYDVSFDYGVGRIPLGSTMVKSDSEGNTQWVSYLHDDADPSVVYRSVGALDFDSGGRLYGVAQKLSVDAYDDSDTNWYLVVIDPDSGRVTYNVAIDWGFRFAAMAFDSSDTLYASPLGGGSLFEVNVSDGSWTMLPAVGLPLTGLDFIDDNLYGVTINDLYAIDPATGSYIDMTGPAVDTGRLDMADLTVDPNVEGLLWTVGFSSVDSYYRVMRLPLSAALNSVRPAGWAVKGGLLIDADQDGWTYTDVTGLDFNSDDKLYAVGRILDVRPFDGSPSPSLNAYLFTIDPSTGLARRVTELDVTGLSSIAFDKDDNLYGVWGAGDLVSVDGASGITSVIGTMATVDPVIGIEFAGPLDTLYALTDGSSTRAALYSINPATGVATLLWNIMRHDGTGGLRNVTSLAENPYDPDRLIASFEGVTLTADGSPHVYFLGEFVRDPALQGHDFGQFNIMGTLAGRFHTEKSVDLIHLGFLYGNVIIGGNLNDIICYWGAGAVDGRRRKSGGIDNNNFQDVWRPDYGDVSADPSSVIRVGGSVRTVDFRGGSDIGEEREAWSYSGVQVGGNPNAPLPSQYIYERETAADDWDDGDAWLGFIHGLLTYSDGRWYDNDSPEHAQFLTHPTGEFWLYGSLGNLFGTEQEADTPNPDGEDYIQDWYALPLMAGQTVMIDGWFELSVPGISDVHVRLYDSGMYTGPGFNPADPAMLMVDSFGYETYEDEGIMSRGSTFEPLVFTAPAAGVYYVVVLSEVFDDIAGEYELHFINGTDEALGGVNVIGMYWADYIYNGGTREDQDTSGAAISAKNGAGLGGIMVWGRSIWTSAYSAGGGDLVSFQAQSIGSWTVGNTRHFHFNTIYSDSNIGRVAAVWDIDASFDEGHINATIIAGHAGGAYNHNAHIQNIYAAADVFVYDQFSATGSIGVIEGAGVLGMRAGMGSIIANSDYDLGRAMMGEPAGNIDLIQIGNYGGLTQFSNLLYAPPRLWTAPGGDVRYICVEGPYPGNGEIWEWSANGGWQASPTIVTDFHSAVIEDDGGGTMKISAIPVAIDRDQDGIQDVDPVTYQPAWWPTDISYIGISVNDWYMGGVGYALARVRIDGPVTINTTGTVHLGELDISYEWIDPTDADPDRPRDQLDIEFTGPGDVHIYYLHDSPTDDTVNFDTVRMTDWQAGGSLNVLSGRLYWTSVLDLRLAGSLGDVRSGTTGAWLHGRDDAPIQNISNSTVGDTEPQFGWYHRKIHGISVSAPDRYDATTGELISYSLNNLRVGGSIRDVRVEGGTIGTIVANFDGITQFDRWDSWEGIEGVIWSDTMINSVAVGDGLADDGSAFAPEAGVFCTGSIGQVTIEGPWYEIAPPHDADINEQLRYRHYYNGRITNHRIYNELNGAIIAFGSNIVLPYIPLPGQDAIGLVRGTNGAKCTSLILGTDLSVYSVVLSWIHNIGFVSTGPVGVVEFSGAGAEIYGAEIGGQLVRRVETSVNSAGINYSHIWAQDSAYRNVDVIGQILAGGPGMHYSTVDVTGGDIGTVKGVGPVADITNSQFSSTQDFRHLEARDLLRNDISIPGKVGTIKAHRDMRDNSAYQSYYPGMTVLGIAAGAIGTLSVGNDFERNDLRVAGELTNMTVGGAVIDSTITMYGPIKAHLKSLVANGDISGQIVSHGTIGQIISKNGTIYADITTVPHSVESHVDLLQAAGGIKGDLDIAGNVKKIVSYSSLGDDPAITGGRTQLFNIWGNLDYLRVQAPRGLQAHLYADVSVGGDIGTIDVDGTLYSNVRTNGNLKKLILDGGLGGTLGGGVGDRGSLTVFGTIGQMKFNTSSDLVADLSIGGSINRITLRNSSIRGDIESRFGSIKHITVNGGSIMGTLTARSIDNVQVRNGSIFGDVRTIGGDIKKLQVTNGSLDANVTAAGKIRQLNVTNGSATAGHSIFAEQGIGKVSIRNGDLAADLISEAGIDKIDIIGSDITGMVNAGGRIGNLKASGAIANTTVRAGGGIDKVDIGALVGSTISSGWNIGRLNIKGDVIGSQILAGHDVGADGKYDTADDNPLNGGLVHSGDISSLQIGGVLDSSRIMAGVDPTNNGEAGGSSSIGRMKVKGGYPNPGLTEVRADTYIDSKFAAEAAAAGVTVFSGVTYTPNTSGAIPFGPTTGAGKMLVIGDLQLTLTSGIGYYRPATGELILTGTGSRSSLTLKNTGAPVTITIGSADDSGLSNLKVIGNVTLGDLSIDGQVRSLNADGVKAGAVWNLPGGVRSAKTGDLDNVSVAAGYLNNWHVRGEYLSGSLAADGIRQFRVDGSMGADLRTGLSGINNVNVRGDMTGDLASRDEIRTLDVRGTVTGDVMVALGDIRTFKIGSGLLGSVDITRGGVRSVNIQAGDFGATDETSFRTGREVNSFQVRSGSLNGLLSVGGDLRNLKVSGQLAGRVWSDGSMRNVQVGMVNEGLLAASGDILKVNVKGDMYGGWILAGFDPGDAGSGAAGGEAGNLKIDAFTSPGWLTSDNADHPSTGMIKNVEIAGDMGRTSGIWGYRYSGSTIAAGIDPGTDGYVGTDDDLIGSTGYIQKVRVKGGIYGSGGAGASYGVFAANNMPIVYHHSRQPFLSSSTAHVGSAEAQGAVVKVTDVQMGLGYIQVTVNGPLNAETINADSFTLLASVDDDFTTAGDNTNISKDIANSIVYSTAGFRYTITMALAGGKTWGTINRGQNFQLTMDGSVVADNRGTLIDGEFIGAFPSGDGAAGGDFVWTTVNTDMADTFQDAIAAQAMTLTVDGGTQLTANVFESIDDVDIYRLTGADAYEFLSVQYFGDPLAMMCVFMRDTQGTADPNDDYFEALARYESQDLSIDSLFEAFELPETGDPAGTDEYYLVVRPSVWSANPLVGGSSYRLAVTLSSSDAQLVADLGGTLPEGEEIAYISNYVGEHNNVLGANLPKQLVYLNFDGGVATKYFEDLGFNVPVAPFDLYDVLPAIDGYEDVIINGGMVDGKAVTGIVDNVMAVYSNTPASYPGGEHIDVQRIDVTDAGDWASYMSASEGLFFTTVDPTLRGLDPETDFTTAFIGEGNDLLFGLPLLGVASDIDVANQSKADNALIFAQNFGSYSSYMLSLDTADVLNGFSMVIAGTTAHEIGHAFGLNHQPTDWTNFWLLSDDPDNNPLTPNDSNTGPGLMAYTDAWVDVNYLLQLGTAELTAREFGVGYLDTADLMIKWLS